MADQNLSFSSKLPVFHPSEFLTSKDETHYVGCGGFAHVRICEHPKLGKVAAKCFAITGTKDVINKRLNDVKREADVLVRMTHHHIVKIYGITNWNFNIVAIILEYIECGNLDGLLQSSEEISWDQRCLIASQINSALKYLHNHPDGKSFYHGDIKPVNVLLDKHLNVKLADFGSVNVVKASGWDSTTLDVAATTQNTARYTAPELMDGIEANRGGPPSDMYSYGMLLYEMIFRTRVYEGAQISEFQLSILIFKGERPRLNKVEEVKASLTNDRDRNIVSLMIELMKKCWNGNQTKRPTAIEVGKTLERVNENDSRLESEKKEISKKLRRHHKTTEQLTSLSSFLPPFREAPDSPKLTMEGKPGTVIHPTLSNLNFNQSTNIQESTNKQESTNIQESTVTDSHIGLKTAASSKSDDVEHQSTSKGNVWRSKPQSQDSKHFLQIGGKESEHDCTKYDVTNNYITRMPKLNERRIGSTSVKVGDCAFTCGGWGRGLKLIASCEVLNLITGDSWELVAPMPERRSYAASAVINGSILVSGGFVSGGWFTTKYESTCLLYDVTRNSWSKSRDMNTVRSSHAMAALDDVAYSIGGLDAKKKTSVLSSCEKYQDDRWLEVPSMNNAKGGLAAVAFDGCIYAIGGAPCTQTVERYDPRTSKWSKVASMNVERRCHGACVLQGKIYAVAGHNERSVEVYDPRADRWTHCFDTQDVRNYCNVVAV